MHPFRLSAPARSRLSRYHQEKDKLIHDSKRKNMVITKELKEKLLQVGSPEEEKALLGEQATEEETARL